MKKFLIYAIVLIAVIAMAKTVPDKKAHKKAMMEAVKAYVDEEASERLIFNTTHVELDDETQVLSLGVLGHVFTFDKQMLRDALEASAKEKAEKKSERKAAKEAAKEARKLEKQQRKEEKRREKQAQKERKKAIKQAKKIRKSVEKEIERQNSDD